MSTNREEAFKQVKILTEAFTAQYRYYKTPAYNEAQLRIDFLNPLLKAFGWDVDNIDGKSAFLRDVIQEEAITVEEDDGSDGPILTKKNPDYTLRVGGERKLFVEAKKVSVDVERNPKPAFQTRRYGWNAGLLVSILTNFDKIILYDCRIKPTANDAVSVARLAIFSYRDLVDKFDELYDLLAFESVASGYIESKYGTVPKLAQPFDAYFLEQIERWRRLLATDIIAKQELDDLTINFLVQRLLNRIVFLRICEDRSIEQYATLQQITDYNQLKTLFVKADKRYNAGLFDFIEDELSLRLTIDTNTLVGIFNELYYPLSPYNFSVVDPAILSQIYEQYLGSRIAVTGSGSAVAGSTVSIVTEAEIAASDGVVSTPKAVAEKIVKETISWLLNGHTIEEVLQLRIADICCGSDIFLLTVFDQLLAYITERLVVESVSPNWVTSLHQNEKQVSIWGKQQIVANCLYGLDINPYAVEVAKFSLYLKLLEGETAATTNDFIGRHKNGVLPTLNQNIKCGNALVDSSIYDALPTLIDDDELLYRVKPFDWQEEFPFLTQTGGFDAIVGNPPYIRIQNMALYAAEELSYYQTEISGYGGTSHESFDKYYLFLQRAIRLLNDKGRLGYIVPHKFFTLTGGQVLRRFITANSYVHKLIHFGVTQVFPGRSTYTAIVVLGRQPTEQFTLVKISNLAVELWKEPLSIEYPQERLVGSEPWIFVSPRTEAIFSKLRSGHTTALKQIVNIPVGLQTSKDEVYIFQPYKEDDTFYYFKNQELIWKNDKPGLGKALIDWKVEKGLCKPCLYDASLHLFQTITPNAQLIFPYTVLSTGAKVFDEAAFQASYSYGWQYMEYYRPILERRSINGSKEPKWYQYGRSQSLTKFHDVPKLIWSVLALRAGYAYDDQNTLFTGGGNGPYYALLQTSNYSLHYILAILSHPLWEAMIKAGSSPFRGGYYSHGRQFLENLPIRIIDFTNARERDTHDAIAQTARQVVDTQSMYDRAKAPPQREVSGRKLKALVDRMTKQVNELYGITEEEIQVVADDELLHVRETVN